MCETVSGAPAIHTEVIPVPLGGNAYVLPMVCALDGTVSSHPLNATGYAPNNAFLFLEEGHALLLRAGFTVHQQALITALNDLLPAECEVSIWNVEVGEFASCANIPGLATALNVTSLISPMDDGGAWVQFRPDDAPFGSPLRAGSLAGLTERRTSRNEHVAVGNGGRALEVLGAPLRLLPTNWIYDETSRTLFTSDAFNHVWQQSPNGPWVLEGEAGAPGDPEAAWEFLLGSRFWWLAGANAAQIREEIDEIFATRDVEVLAPSFGCVIKGRAAVEEHVQLFDDLLAAAPTRPSIGLDVGTWRAQVSS